ncbi:MAG: AAA family ATPase, partial [Bacteroidetes bacterium]|nr:AAA family ATPase [Bacteroidota bacterium]
MVPLYPFVPGANGKCSCGQEYCQDRFIHPRLYKVHESASDEEVVIRQWAEQWSQADLATLLGPGSGIIAISANSKGERELARLEERYARLPITPTIDWLDDKRWYIFTHPGRPVKGKPLAPGLRLLGDGDLLRLPPSLYNRRSTALSWIEPPGLTDLASVPHWLWRAYELDTLAAETSVSTAARVRRPSISATTLPFQRLSALQEEEKAAVRWVAKPWAAEGALTVLVGPAKRGGKSTFVRDFARAVVSGDDILGHATAQHPALILSEDPPGVVEQTYLEMGFTGHPAAQHLHVLPFRSVRGISFPELIDECRKHAQQVGARLLIVDSLLRFAQLDHLHDIRQQHISVLDGLKEAGIAVVATASYDARLHAPPGDTIDGIGLLATVSDTVMELYP